MVELRYRLSFNTPAFLGNAEQQAQWRTPPIKTLIRQWWRVVKARSVMYDATRLLDAENHLFGAAGEEGRDCGQSRIRLRLNEWTLGQEKPPPGDTVEHRESPTRKVAANTYLGYGPLGTRSERLALAAESKTQNLLRLRIQPRAGDQAVSEIQQAIQLAAWFGGLGSRSRNGFGSMHWEAVDGTPPLQGLSPGALSAISLDFDQALRRDWPHAIGLGSDGRPLVWLSNRTHPTWIAAMKELAVLKISLRTSDFFKFAGGGRSGHAEPLRRHVLAYPSGGQHTVDAKGWGKDGRMANQVRLRLHREKGGFRGVIVHVPCGVPAHMRKSVRQLPDERGVWDTVHRFFDSRPEVARLGG